MSTRVSGSELEILDLPGDDRRNALILLHEGLGSVGLWRSFPAELHRVTGRRVIAFSRYGHGRSPRPPHPRTTTFFHEEALEVLPELLARLEAPEAVVIGHSDGASIGLIYAAHHRVSGLVLIAPHVFVEELTVSAIRSVRETYRSGELRARMARHHDDPDAAFWGWCDVWLDPAFRDWCLEEEISRLRARTLLIQGEDDLYGSLEQIDRIETRAGGPVHRLVLPGGHSPHLEHPEQVVEAISRFVATV